MSFVSVLETIGKGFAKGLKWAVEYAVPVERLVGLLFPAAAPVAVAPAAPVASNSRVGTLPEYHPGSIDRRSDPRLSDRR